MSPFILLSSVSGISGGQLSAHAHKCLATIRLNVGFSKHFEFHELCENVPVQSKANVNAIDDGGEKGPNLFVPR